MIKWSNKNDKKGENKIRRNSFVSDHIRQPVQRGKSVYFIISINGIIIVSMINMMMNDDHLQLEVSFDKLVIAAGGDSGEVCHFHKINFHKIDIRNKINFHKINMRNKIKITDKLSDHHLTVAPISTLSSFSTLTDINFSRSVDWSGLAPEKVPWLFPSLWRRGWLRCWCWWSWWWWWCWWPWCWCWLLWSMIMHDSSATCKMIVMEFRWQGCWFICKRCFRKCAIMCKQIFEGFGQSFLVVFFGWSCLGCWPRKSKASNFPENQFASLENLN